MQFLYFLEFGKRPTHGKQIKFEIEVILHLPAFCPYTEISISVEKCILFSHCCYLSLILPIRFLRILKQEKKISVHLIEFKTFPAGNDMFKVNNRNTRTRCEICSKLTIKIPERRRLISLLLTLGKFHTLF